MKLKVKDVDISTGSTFIVLLHQDDAQKYDLHYEDRVRLKNGRRSCIAIVDIAQTKAAVKPGHIGLFEEVLKELNAKQGDIVKVDIEDKPKSVVLIKKKLKGHRLTTAEINEIIKDIVNNALSAVELTYFVSGCYTKGLSKKETIELTKAIVKQGSKLRLKREVILDKHCSGGVAGNRTTMLIVPIVAAAGLTMPKTSSRSITSPAGTADTMEVLAKVSFPAKKMAQIVRKTNGCIVWGGAINLASADDKMIKVRHPLSLDPPGMLLASIMAKKSAVGATHVLIDIPLGKDTKIKSRAKARKLKKDFIRLGRKIGMKIKVIITDGTEPIGNGIGPALEARDVLKVLMNKHDAPKDLRKKALFMAGLMLKMGCIKKPHEKAREILDSGLAFKKMKQIIKLQGGKCNVKPEDIHVGRFSYNLKAKKKGKIYDINNALISSLARIAGAPKNKGAGIYLYKHEFEEVEKGEKIFTIYAENKKRLKYALRFLESNKVVTIR